MMFLMILMTLIGLNASTDQPGAERSSRIVATVETPNVAKCVTVEGRYAYVGYRGGMLVYDVANPLKPELISTITTGSYVNEIRVDGGRAYLACSFDGVIMLDVSDPANPIRLSQLNGLGEVTGIDVYGDTIYASATSKGLITIELDESAFLSIVDQRRVTLSGQGGPTVHAMSVQRVGQNIYLSGRSTGLAIIVQLGSSSPQDVSVIRTADEAFGFEIVGTTAFICDQDTGFTTIDVSSARWPEYLATLPLPGFAYTVEVEGTRAYVASTDAGIHVIDVYDPAVPSLIEQIHGLEWAFDIEVVGRHGFVADGRGGFKVIEFARD